MQVPITNLQLWAMAEVEAQRRFDETVGRIVATVYGGVIQTAKEGKTEYEHNIGKIVTREYDAAIEQLRSLFPETAISIKPVRASSKLVINWDI